MTQGVSCFFYKGEEQWPNQQTLKNYTPLLRTKETTKGRFLYELLVRQGTR